MAVRNVALAIVVLPAIPVCVCVCVCVYVCVCACLCVIEEAKKSLVVSKYRPPEGSSLLKATLPYDTNNSLVFNR